MDWLYWLVVVWIAAAVAAAWVHHRLRQRAGRWPHEVEEFLARLQAALQSQRDVEFVGMLPGRFACLLRVNGQETPVSLQEAFRHSVAHPDRFGAMVAQLLADVRELGLDRLDDHEFLMVTDHLLPQVRSQQWVAQQGAFGPGGLVSTALNDELSVVYVIDDAQSMVFVCRAHLQRWRRGVADIHNLALINLRRRSAPVDGDAASQLVAIGDGYDASRVLLLDRAPDLLIAVPDRDTLWAGHAGGDELHALMAATEQSYRGAAHPISGELFRWHDGELQRVSGTAPAAARQPARGT